MEYFLFPKFRDLHADNCGYAILSPNWTHPRRRLGSSVLLLGVRGSVPLAEGTEEYTLGPGTMALLPAGRIHWGPSPLTAPAMYFWFHFSLQGPPELLSQSLADPILSDRKIAAHKLDGAALLPLRYQIAEPGQFYQAFRNLLVEQEKPSYSRLNFQIMFQSLLISLTDTVLSAYFPEGTGTGGVSVTNAVVTKLFENLTDPGMSIKSVAGSIGMNPDYVGRKFKEVMGLSVGEYILKKRVELAVRLLQDGGNSIETIGNITGFGSFRNFLRQFKSEKGCTPSEIRNRYRTMHVNSL